MKACIVRLPQDLVDALKEHRQTSGTSAAEFVRRAIRLTLFAEAQAKRFVGPKPDARPEPAVAPLSAPSHNWESMKARPPDGLLRKKENLL